MAEDLRMVREPSAELGWCGTRCGRRCEEQSWGWPGLILGKMFVVRFEANGGAIYRMSWWSSFGGMFRTWVETKSRGRRWMPTQGAEWGVVCASQSFTQAYHFFVRLLAGGLRKGTRAPICRGPETATTQVQTASKRGRGVGLAYTMRDSGWRGLVLHAHT